MHEIVASKTVNGSDQSTWFRQQGAPRQGYDGHRAWIPIEVQLGGHGHALQTKNSAPWSRAFESLCIAAAACAFAWASFSIAACDQMRGAE